jgi:hypothetical protein
MACVRFFLNSQLNCSEIFRLCNCNGRLNYHDFLIFKVYCIFHRFAHTVFSSIKRHALANHNGREARVALGSFRDGGLHASATACS